MTREYSEIFFTLNIIGLERTVQQLIDGGAAVNSINNNKKSALILAAQSGEHNIRTFKSLSQRSLSNKCIFLSLRIRKDCGVAY